MVGARFLRRQLQTSTPLTLGLGWGRTLAAVAEQTLRERYSQHRFVALIGSLTRHSAANPYDVIHRMVDRTESEGFFLPTPYIADTLADKSVFMAQKSVQDILALAQASDVCMVGIGRGGEDSFLKNRALITDSEFNELKAAGAVGDLIGKFFDRDGRLVDSEVNERSMGLELAQLAACNAIAIAGGEEKVDAIAAALRSGTLAGLITDENVARKLSGEASGSPRQSPAHEHP
jgi:DNA-binding transcriptional regulator LsrR (DeoR family)